MAYYNKYSSEFTSQLGVNYKVYIQQNYVTGGGFDPPINPDVLVMGGEPVTINYNGNEGKFETLRGSECAVTFYPTADFQFSEIVKANKNDFKIQIYKNDVFYWSGFIIQDNYNEPFMPLPYQVTLRATDGLGDLKFLDFKNLDGSLFISKMTQIDALIACLRLLNNGLKVDTRIDILEDSIDTSVTSYEALNQIYINPYIYLKNSDKVGNCADVVKSILEIYNAYIYYKEDVYYIDRLNYKLNDNVVQHSYNLVLDGTSATTNIVSTVNISGSIGRNSGLKFINNDASITYQTPYKYLNIDNKSNLPDALILNSKFLNWTGSVPTYWTNNTLYIQKASNNKSDSILKIVNSSTTPSTSSPYLTFANTSFSAINRGDNLKINLAFYGNIRIVIKISDGSQSQWLYKYTDGSYVWGNSFATVSAQSPDGDYSTPRPSGLEWTYDSWFTAEFNSISINRSITPTRLDVYVLPSYDVSTGYSGYGYLREFNVNLVSNNTSKYEGENYSLTTDTKFLETYSDLNPVFGEFGSAGITNQLLNYSTFFTPTDKWLRHGKTESKPLLQIAATSILNQYRTPYIQFHTSIFGDFDFGKAYTIQTLAGRFIPFKAQLNLKTDVSAVDFFELLPESDTIEANYTYTKKGIFGSSDYNSIDTSQGYNPYIPVSGGGGSGSGGGRPIRGGGYG